MAKNVPLNKYEFSVEIDGKPIGLVVVKPTRKDEQDAEEEKARVYTKLFREKALIAAEVEKAARERNLWDDNRQTNLESISKFLQESEKVVSGRVKGTTKSEGRKVAIEMRKKRNEQVAIQRDRSALSNQTAESKSENAKFNFVMSRCVRYSETNKPYYKDVDDMFSRESDPAFDKAFKGMMRVYMDMDPDWQKDLPENKFLLKYNYCNDELLLIDPVTKKLVDEDGKFINDQGRWVNEEGHLINANGELVDEDGNIQGETFEFLEDSEPKEIKEVKTIIVENEATVV